MAALILLLLFLTGEGPVPADGTAPTTTSETEPTDDPASEEGGDAVRKSPIG